MQPRLITDRPAAGLRTCAREGCKELAWYQGAGRPGFCDACKAPRPCAIRNCENLRDGPRLCSMHEWRAQRRHPMNALKQQGIPFPKQPAYAGDQGALFSVDDADPAST